MLRHARAFAVFPRSKMSGPHTAGVFFVLLGSVCGDNTPFAAPSKLNTLAQTHGTMMHSNEMIHTFDWGVGGRHEMQTGRDRFGCGVCLICVVE